MQSKIILFLMIISLGGFFSGCGKENRHIIPEVGIRVAINLNAADRQVLKQSNIPLHIPNYLGNTIGYLGNGILVMKIFDDQYVSYDATCTKCLTPGAVVKPEKEDATGTCQVCRTEFFIFSGEAILSSGSEEKIYPLKGYGITKTGDWLRINN